MDPSGSSIRLSRILAGPATSRRSLTRSGAATPARPSACPWSCWLRYVVDGRPSRSARRSPAQQPRTSLVGLARLVGASPHHLSRIFRRRTGESVSGYRNRLRVRRALERLAAGERSLSGLAADLGFTDHSHLVRALRAEVHAPP